MKNIKVLDCTLRDGGYVNNWQFGAEAIDEIVDGINQSNVDIIELGFMRNEAYNPNRSIYNSISQIENILKGKKKNDTIYTALIEMANYFPPEMLDVCSSNGPDAIRYSFWKRCLDEAYEYCEMIKSKGYKLFVQPTRVEQYSDADFAELCQRFSKLEPYALYIVDTFGLLTANDVVRYAKIADENLSDGIRIGYHVHNNMGQAFANATAFVNLDLKHDICVDASVSGIGRGAGNLFTEAIITFLNDNFKANYCLKGITDKCADNINEVAKHFKWGYNMHYYLAALYHCNPNYASVLLERGVSVKDANSILSRIEGKDKYLFNKDILGVF